MCVIVDVFEGDCGSLSWISAHVLWEVFQEKHRELHFGMHQVGTELVTSHMIMVHWTTNTTYYITTIIT